MRLQYSLSFLMCISALVALFLLKNMSGWLFLSIIEAIFIFAGVELLHRRMPKQLREARSDNCRRMDGSVSEHRLAHERRALNKVRMDLLAVFLIVALSGNWLAFFVHCEIIPFPVALKAVGAFDLDVQTWKQNLRNERVDDAFEEWSVSRTPADHQAVEKQQETLWYAWPLVVLVLLGWVVGSMIFISRTYLMIIRSYAAGVAARAEHNVNRDIARLQEASMH